MNKKVIKISTLGMSRAEWLLERKNSLGGSDMGAVLGLNRYRSSYSVWAEKTGRLPEQEDNEAMRIGRDLEPYVLQRFTALSGKKTRHCHAILRNPDFPHLHANVDSLVVGEDSGVEAKTASALNLKAFAGGEFPESYYAQCVAYLAVTGLRRWYLAALIMGREFKIYRITTVKDDEDLDWLSGSVYVAPEEITALGAAAKDFWEEHIAKDIPPAVDGTEGTGKALAAVLHESSDETVDLGLVRQNVREYLRLKAEAERLKEAMELHKQKIQIYMGSAGRAENELCSISWKEQTRKTLDTKALQKAHPEWDLSPFFRVSSARPFKVTVKEG